MSSQPLSARAPDWQELVSECVSLVSVTIVSSLFGAKLAAGVEWKSLPYSKGLVLSLYAFVWTFVTSSCLLVSTNDGNIISCSLSILACDVFYAGSKIITYLWLVEKVWVVQAVKTHRLRTPLYILNLVLMLPYIGIFILMVMFRISYITDQNTCIIGLQPIASIPLLVYDFVFNSYITLLFLRPLLWRNKNAREWPHSRLSHVARRTLVAAIVCLIASFVNVMLVVSFHGQERGVLCLTCCTLDVTVNLITIHWVTTPPRKNTNNNLLKTNNHHNNLSTAKVDRSNVFVLMETTEEMSYPRDEIVVQPRDENDTSPMTDPKHMQMDEI